MIEAFQALVDTPVPGLLVLAGLLFVMLALTGNISTVIDVLPEHRQLAAFIGTLFIFSGIIIYVLPAILNSTNSTALIPPSTPATLVPSSTISTTPASTHDNSLATSTVTTETQTPRLTNTPQPAFGTVLFQEDFEDGRAQGIRFDGDSWNILDDDTDNNQVLDFDNRSTCCLGEAAFGSVEWTDYSVQYRFRVLEVAEGANAGIYLFFRKISGDFEGPYYVQASYVDEPLTGRVTLYRVPDANQGWLGISYTGVLLPLNEWVSVRVEVQGDKVDTFIDGTRMVDAESLILLNGSVGLGVQHQVHAQFDDIRVVNLAS